MDCTVTTAGDAGIMMPSLHLSADFLFPENIHSSVYFVSNLMRLTRENIPTIKREIGELTECPKAISLAVWDQGPSLKLLVTSLKNSLTCSPRTT